MQSNQVEPMSGKVSDYRKYLTPEGVFQEFHIPVATLATWRCRGGGPVFTKAGAKVLYNRADIEGWLVRRANTSQTVPA
ncbi:MAG: hypothetical protein ACOVN5_06185 [Aquidulcibacter sp.]